MRGYNSGPSDLLFHQHDWHTAQDGWKQQLASAIEAMDGDQLLNTSTTDLARYYANEYFFEAPSIHSESLEVDQREIQIDVSRDTGRYIRDRSRAFFIPGTAIDVEIPYSGNKVGFDLQPSTWSSVKPCGNVTANAVRFTISGADLTQEAVKNEIDRRIAGLNEHLEWLRNDARGYNAGLEQLATQTIERRKEKLLRDNSLLAGLGFKMKQRPGAAETYAAPQVRRKIRPATPKPSASRTPYKPEPTLTVEDYEHILTVLENMVSVMEQSPAAFREIDEESLRTHFLVQLNGHFSGDATGETFNYEGKTDILIKAGGRNIFIGECKFWTGEKAYLETLDQVLSYLSWRDTKAAVLIFSRNKDFTGVVEKISSSTQTHANFKRLVNSRSESSWTYLFGHKDDPNREISITVQAYNVPERIKPRIRPNRRQEGDG